jgi:hypothetical protein
LSRTRQLLWWRNISATVSRCIEDVYWQRHGERS